MVGFDEEYTPGRCDTILAATRNTRDADAGHGLGGPEGLMHTSAHKEKEALDLLVLRALFLDKVIP